MSWNLKKFGSSIAAGVFCGLCSQLAIADWYYLKQEDTVHWASGSAVALSDICSCDINGDGEVEIISIATTVDADTGTRQAELRVARWTGNYYDLLDEQLWSVDGNQYINSRAVECADLDGNGALGIVTAVLYGEPLIGSEIKVWRWGASSNSLEASEPLLIGGTIYALATGDVDDALGGWKIIGGGRSIPGSDLELYVLDVDAEGAPTEAYTESWRVDDAGGSVRGIAVANVDDDEDIEIVTTSTLDVDNGQEATGIRVWRWNGSVLDLEAQTIWLSEGNSTDASAVAVGNMDGEASPDIAVVGTAPVSGFVPRVLSGVVSIWQKDGDALELRDHDTWHSQLGNGSSVEYFALAVANVATTYGESADEVIVAGPVHPHELPAENVLRVYQWDEGRLQLKDTEEWIADGMDYNFLYAVHAADVDGDNRVEIITGGRGVNSEGSSHQVTIWHVKWWPMLGLSIRTLLERLFPELFPEDQQPDPWLRYVFAGLEILVVVATFGIAIFAVRRLISYRK